MKRPSCITSSDKQKSVFEPGELEKRRKERREMEAAQREKEAREESYRNGLYANRHQVMETNGTLKDLRDSSNRSSRSDKLRSLFKRDDSDPYAATYDRGNSAADNAISALELLAPSIVKRLRYKD